MGIQRWCCEISTREITGCRFPELLIIASKIEDVIDNLESQTELTAVVIKRFERYYLQPHNLVIRFGADQLDQSQDLMQALSKRSGDQSQFVAMNFFGFANYFWRK